MRGIYTAEIKCSSLAASKSLMTIQAASSKVVEIIEAYVQQTGSNSTTQNIEVSLTRVTTYGSPTGTSVTPNPEESGDQAASSTVLGNLTAEPTTYGVNVDHQGATSIGGYQFIPSYETKAYIAPGAAAGLRMLSTPTSADFVVMIKFKEIG